MTEPIPDANASPLKDASHSIYAYQTRLMRNSSVSGGGDSSSSPPATPSGSGTILSRMNSLREDANMNSLRRTGSGARMGSHGRGNKSVDLVRGQWEAKIGAASTVGEPAAPATATPPARPRSMLVSSSRAAFESAQPEGSHTASPAARDSALGRSSTIRDRKKTLFADSPTRSTPDEPKVGSAESNHAQPELATQTPPRARPASVSAAVDFSPIQQNDTGASTATTRNKSSVDTLAEARANALRRLQAKKAAGIQVEEPKLDLPPEIPIPPVQLDDNSPPRTVSRMGPKHVSTPLVPTVTPKITPIAALESKLAATSISKPTDTRVFPSPADLNPVSRSESESPKDAVPMKRATLSSTSGPKPLPVTPTPKTLPDTTSVNAELSKTPVSKPETKEAQHTASQPSVLLPKRPNALALPNSPQDSPVKGSPFGERLRPATRSDEKPSSPSSAVSPPSSASATSPFGERLRVKRPEAALPAPEESKPEYPTLRKTRSVDLGDGPSSPSKLLPRADQQRDAPVLRRARSILDKDCPSKNAEASPSKLLPRTDYVQPAVPVHRRARSIAENKSESPSKLMPKDAANNQSPSKMTSRADYVQPTVPVLRRARSIIEGQSESPTKSSAKDTTMIKSNVAASIASIETPVDNTPAVKSPVKTGAETTKALPSPPTETLEKSFPEASPAPLPKPGFPSTETTQAPATPKPMPFNNDAFSTPKATPSPSKWANLGYRAPTAPPKGSVSVLASRFGPPEGGPSSPAPRGRVPSMGTDRRRLGKHLPRIVSGDMGWEGDSTRKVSRKVSAKDRKASGTRLTVTTTNEENTPPPDSTPIKARHSPASTPSRAAATPPRATPLTPSHTVNREPESRVTSTASKTKSSLLGSLVTSPRAEVHGEEMKDLMSVISAAPARQFNTDGGAGVAGMSNRLKLSQTQRLPLAASSAKVAPAPLPSRRLNNNWMDRQRHALAAYEYLCHIGEAQQWIEGCLDEELEFGVTEMEEGLRDGVVLAKLSRAFQGEQIVRRIWTEAKHRYRQSDNINYFLTFVRSVGMPETFIFELTDLYNKKNIPKVIFCIHVLSHLLARLGRAERMNNLLGQFEFTDEQLEATQKGIQGVAMPNFQQVGQTLAKEASWEPEPEEEVETEDEMRDRLLLEREDSIFALQRHLRGVLARQRASRVKAQLKLAAPIVVQIQSAIRGNAVRKARKDEKRSHGQLAQWASAIQAVSRGQRVRQKWQAHVNNVRDVAVPIVGVQAHVRGMLVRLRASARENELDRLRRNVIGLQAVCRGWLVRRDRKADRKTLAERSVVQSITSLQGVLRGRLSRQKIAKEQQVVQAHTATFTRLQGHLRSALVRRQHKAHEKKMDDATSYVVSIQSMARGVLARRRKQVFAKEAVTVSTAVVSLQALARARLAKRTHESMQKALAKVEIAGSVGGLQAFLRTKLAKRQTVEQKKKLEFVQPDVIGFQAVARGFIARQEYREWRDYLVDPHTQGALVFLQSLIRGFICRRRYWLRIAHFHRNVDKIVKIQSVWRGRKQRQMYDRLITGVGVDVPTIQNYMHLLDDTENDFRDQLRIDTLRKEVVELVRANQTLDTEVQELDTKIALILKNKMSFEDLVRAKRRHGQPTGEDSFNPPGGGDPFSNVHLDRTSQRKLALYEHLFFTLQTEPQYLCRLLHKLAADPELEKDRRLVEAVTLILFGFGHDRREEYLFHKLLQMSVHEQVLRSRSLEELSETRFALIPVVTQFVKPLLTPYLQNVLFSHVDRVIQSDALDLSTDPVDIYNRFINDEESLTGVKSTLPRGLTADQILETHGETRAVYIQHLQELRALTNELAKSLMASTAQLPYTVRLFVREALFACRVRFQGEDESMLWPVVAKSVILPFILPGLIAPETYGIAQQVNPVQRRNLSAIANLLTHVATQNFTNLDKDRLVRVPLDNYIRAEGKAMGDWTLDVAEVDFQNQEMLESTSEATPISITRSDIYGLLGVMVRNIPAVTAGKSGDPMESVLNELEGPPLEYDRGKNTVRVRLTNRLAQLQPSDPRQAQLREMEVQAKRHVLAVLRVQSGKTLYDIFLDHPGEKEEQRWIYEVHRDIALEQARLARHDLPPTPAEAEYQMESIRALPFHEVKSRAIEFCMALQEHGRLDRDSKFQGLLVSIASDIKEKHRLRQKRKVDLRAMSEAHANLTEKRQDCEERIQSYHDYIDSAMAALQQKKKAPFMSKHFWHQKRHGAKKSKFGSYRYTAAELYEKGVLLSVNQCSPRQFDKIHIVISSDDVGVFTLELTNTIGAGVGGTEELRMEDLLQAQFDNNVRLDLFDASAAFNLNMLIHQINKKFYAS